jgi:putative ABC transport system permease protein
MSFYFRYALRSLRRDSTRTLLAMICVAFGVLSVVSMQLLANTLLDGSMFNLRLAYTGDAQVYSEADSNLREDEIRQIEQWQADDVVQDYTFVSHSSSFFLKTNESGRVTLLQSALGIDPHRFPLVGELSLSQPSGKTAADVLLSPTDALLTRDVVGNLGLQVGDTFVLSSMSATPTRLTLAGIIGATPNQQGKAVYYTYETARLLENREDVYTYATVLWGDRSDAMDTTVASPMRVAIAVEQEGRSESASLFDLMLKGAGVLGLLVGGLGVSNTLQVMMARRKGEIAMLKTMGYKQRNLLQMIMLETGIVGLVGGIVGGVLGSIIAGKLIQMLSGSGSLMLNWSPDSLVVIGGISAGVFTAVVFGLQSMIAISATRPIELLRDLPHRVTREILIRRTVVYAFLILVFGVLVGILFESLFEGVLLVIGGLIALMVMRGVFWIALWVVLRVPLPLTPILRMSRNNLHYRKTAASLILLALFAGAFSVTFTAMTIYSAQNRLREERGDDDGYNLLIYTTPDGVEAVNGATTLQGVAGAFARYRVNGAALNGDPIRLEGRDVLPDVEIISGEWGAMLSEDYTALFQIGDSVTVEAHGQSESLTLTGFYRPKGGTGLIEGDTQGLLVSKDVALSLGGERTQVAVVGSVPVERLDTATTNIGLAIPDALVFSKADINDMMVNTYRSLFAFAASISGLAFVAGAVLIANSVGVTVVERRREMGVLKAVGYTAGHVLRLMLSEYALLGLISGIFGIIAVVIAITLINFAQPAAQLQIEPVLAIIMVIFSTGIALVSAALVAWQPTRVRPLDVLRYE